MIKKLFSFLVAVVFAAVFFFPAPVHGSPWAVLGPSIEAVSPMEKGDKAPFAGVLYSTAAAAKVQVQLETAQEQCDIDKKHELDKQVAVHNLALANEKAAKEAAQSRLNEVVDLKNDQIQFLTKEIERNAKKNKRNLGTLWFSIGIVGGIILTAVAAYSFKQINK